MAMGWTLDALRELIIEKFIKTPLIDVNTKETELQTVKKALAALKAWGLPLTDYRDIVQLYYLLFYHDDEYASKLIAGADDQMQSAKATLFSLTGDCEDIHRLYQLAAIALGIPINWANLMILFFGDGNKIVGGHATTLIKEPSRYINLDYNVITYSYDIDGILGYHSRYGQIVAYGLLSFDESTAAAPVMKYNPPQVYKAPKPKETYKSIVAKEHPAIASLKYHLHRTSEHPQNNNNKALYIIGALTVGMLIGGALR